MAPAVAVVVALLGLGWVPLTNAADKPHVLMLLADDFGWANAGASSHNMPLSFGWCNDWWRSARVVDTQILARACVLKTMIALRVEKSRSGDAVAEIS